MTTKRPLRHYEVPAHKYNMGDIVFVKFGHNHNSLKQWQKCVVASCTIKYSYDDRCWERRDRYHEKWEMEIKYTLKPIGDNASGKRKFVTKEENVYTEEEMNKLISDFVARHEQAAKDALTKINNFKEEML